MQLTHTLYIQNQSGFEIYCLPVIRNDQIRDGTKISSCQVNTTSRQGIKQLGIPFGSIFLLFSYGSSQGHVHNTVDREIPSAQLFMTALPDVKNEEQVIL